MTARDGLAEAGKCTGVAAAAGAAAGAERPLAGRSVVVTRARAQAAALAERLEALGAEVLALPLLEIANPEDWAPVDRALRSLERYDWLVLSSANGVDKLLERLGVLGFGAEALRGVRIAAVGSTTAERMRECGLGVDLVPADFRAEGLVEAFRGLIAGSGTLGSADTAAADTAAADAAGASQLAARPLRVLIARAAEAREVLPDSLREMGCAVDVVVTYRSAPVDPDPAVFARLRAGDVDAVTLTSGAIARRLVRVLADGGADPAGVLGGVVVATIGPVTTAALGDLGPKADVEAPEASVEALAGAVVDALAGVAGREV